MRALQPITVLGTLTASLLAFGCGGSGAELEDDERTVLETCDDCHDSATFESLLGNVRNLDAALFTAERFPDALFSEDLRSLDAAALIAGANPARDADIPPDAPKQQAWLLHELHTLELQLGDDPPSDFTSQARFDAYLVGGDPLPFGCETLDRLDLARFDSPSQMPPPWTEPLFDTLGRTYTPLDEASRVALEDYVEAVLPRGPASCF